MGGPPGEAETSSSPRVSPLPPAGSLAGAQWGPDPAAVGGSEELEGPAWPLTAVSLRPPHGLSGSHPQPPAGVRDSQISESPLATPPVTRCVGLWHASRPMNAAGTWSREPVRGALMLRGSLRSVSGSEPTLPVLPMAPRAVPEGASPWARSTSEPSDSPGVPVHAAPAAPSLPACLAPGSSCGRRRGPAPGLGLGGSVGAAAGAVVPAPPVAVWESGRREDGGG